MAAARFAKANRGGPKGLFEGLDRLIDLVEFERKKFLVDARFVFMVSCSVY